MTKNNPFPGMNPFLERFWPDVHTALIGYIRDSITEQLPTGLKARSEENISLASDEDEGGRTVRADIAVVESWKLGIPPRWEPAADREGGLVATEPVYVMTEEETERWIEISDRNGKLVTVIEVLSPTNKEDGRTKYIAKRQSYVAGGVNVVEIDLLRGGRHSVAVPASSLRPVEGTHYITCVTRAANPARKEVYRTPLPSPLPNIRIPLRDQDADIVLVLQPLVDRCYRMGSYWEEDHEHLIGPALNAEDAAWVKEQVRALHEKA